MPREAVSCSQLPALARQSFPLCMQVPPQPNSPLILQAMHSNILLHQSLCMQHC